MKKKPLIIVGGGEHARMVVEAARSDTALFDLLGFVDPKSRPHMIAVAGIPQLGDDEAVARYPEASGVLGVGVAGFSDIRQRIVARLTSAIGEWTAVLHRDALVHSDVRIGEGSVIMARATVSPGAQVGKHCIVNTGVIVEHDVTIGHFSQLGPGVVIGGGTTVGTNVFIGLGATVRDHVTIGDDAVIGMGSVVVADVPRGASVMGVPAKQRME